MKSMKLVIPLHSLYWSIHTKDESKRGIAFAFIFGVNWLWRWGVTASFGVFFHEIKCNGMTSFVEFMPSRTSPSASLCIFLSAPFCHGASACSHIWTHTGECHRTSLAHILVYFECHNCNSLGLWIIMERGKFDQWGPLSLTRFWCLSPNSLQTMLGRLRARFSSSFLLMIIND